MTTKEGKVVLEKGKVSSRQGVLLLTFTVVVSTAVLTVPAITAAAAGRDGWICTLVVATVYGLLTALVIIKLWQRFPNKTIIEYSQIITGPLGKVVGAAYILWFIHINSVVVREFGDFILTSFMPETPLIAFIIILLILGAWATKSGLEVICRANEFIFPLFTLSIAGVFLLAMQEADFSNLLPVMENGIKPILRGSWAPMAWRGEIIVISMLLPYVDDSDNIGKYLAYSVIIIGIILTFATVFTTAVIGELTKYLSFPFFELARCITIGRFIERVEALVLVMWVAGVTIKVATFFYIASLGTGQLLGLSDYRPVVLPLGLLLGVWSLELFESSIQSIQWLTEVFSFYAFVFELGIPLVLLIIAVLTKKGGQQKSE